MTVNETFLQTLEEAARAHNLDAKTAAVLRPIASRHLDQTLRITFSFEGTEHQVTTRVHSARVVVAKTCELYLEVNACYLGTRVIDAIVVTRNSTVVLIGHHRTNLTIQQETLLCEIQVEEPRRR